MGERQVRKQAEAGDEWMSLPDAAEELGVTRQTVLTLGIKGELKTQSVADRVVVSRASVEKRKLSIAK